MTLKQAKKQMQEIGLSINKRDGEYRVTKYMPFNPQASEAMAYYTNDLEDAVATGERMALVLVVDLKLS